MRVYLDCIPCFFNQALRAGRMVTDDEKQIKELLDEIGILLKDISLNSNPAQMAELMYEKIRTVTQTGDLYREIKRENTRESLSLYPSMKEKIESSSDRLFTAIKIAIAGNIIDFGVNSSFDIEQEINEVFECECAICDYEQFKSLLEKTDEILYIGDNAGEAVFDRMLIEEIKKPVTYVVRGIPVINDVTYEDALQAEVDKVATIISSGSHAPGTVIATCSREFQETFNNARFIISKGQGNYEALSDENKTIFFLLKAKCHVIAQHLGVNIGDSILKGINCSDNHT